MDTLSNLGISDGCTGLPFPFPFLQITCVLSEMEVKGRGIGDEDKNQKRSDDSKSVVMSPTVCYRIPGLGRVPDKSMYFKSDSESVRVHK